MHPVTITHCVTILVLMLIAVMCP